MSTVTDLERQGYVHETCCYDSDDELLDVVIPFLEEGRRDGDAILVNFGPEHSALVRRALGDAEDDIFVPAAGRYSSPAATIHEYTDRFESMLAAGATRIRAVGEIPQPGVGAPWDPWARYEAAVNHAYAHLPVWGICTYDRRTTPPHVLDDVVCTHPRIATADGRHERNERFVAPERWLRERPDPPMDPIQQTTPVLELHDPWPHEARQAVEPLAAHLDPGTTDDLATSVSEVVANALAHGEPPTIVRAWTTHDRVVVAVSDRGRGPTDPFAGLLPPQRALGQGGLGLWIAHQLCSDVAMTRTADGFSIRIAAGAPFAG